MTQKSDKSKDVKLLQVYVKPGLHKALQQYCLDKETKNAPVVRKLLVSSLRNRDITKKGKNNGKY